MSAGLVDGYSATAAAVSLSNSIQMVTLSTVMRHELRESVRGYLKKNTLYPNMSLVGFLLVKEKKEDVMSVEVPVHNQKYVFNWNVSKEIKKEYEKLYVFYE